MNNKTKTFTEDVFRRKIHFKWFKKKKKRVQTIDLKITKSCRDFRGLGSDFWWKILIFKCFFL